MRTSFKKKEREAGEFIINFIFKHARLRDLFSFIESDFLFRQEKPGGPSFD